MTPLLQQLRDQLLLEKSTPKICKISESLLDQTAEYLEEIRQSIKHGSPDSETLREIGEAITQTRDDLIDSRFDKLISLIAVYDIDPEERANLLRFEFWAISGLHDCRVKYYMDARGESR